MSNHWIKHPTTLHGEVADLLPLEEDQFDVLFAAASDKRIFEFYTGDWSVRSKFDQAYRTALELRAKGMEYPLVIALKKEISPPAREGSGVVDSPPVKEGSGVVDSPPVKEGSGVVRIIGSTRIMDIAPYDRRVEIGGTWLMPEYWGTAINADCKLALLTFCFETMNANRVQFKTQHDNLRSRKAIEKVGGVFEGVIRQHILKDDGTFRSSAYYSILKEEWPGVKTRLRASVRTGLKRAII